MMEANIENNIKMHDMRDMRKNIVEEGSMPRGFWQHMTKIIDG
jgi:hypothetical protein